MCAERRAVWSQPSRVASASASHRAGGGRGRDHGNHFGGRAASRSGLWKVSKGDHVLWVFGTYSPLPKKMEWRSKQVEAILAQSQEYLQPPGATSNVGFFRQMTLLPFAIGVKKNPDGAELKDLLPEPVYARWLVLKKKYIGDDYGIGARTADLASTPCSARGEQAGSGSGGREVRETIESLSSKSNNTTSTVAKWRSTIRLRCS